VNRGDIAAFVEVIQAFGGSSPGEDLRARVVARDLIDRSQTCAAGNGNNFLLG